MPTVHGLTEMVCLGKKDNRDFKIVACCYILITSLYFCSPIFTVLPDYHNFFLIQSTTFFRNQRHLSEHGLLIKLNSNYHLG